MSSNKAKQVLFLIYDTAYLLEQSSRHGCLYLLEIGCDAGLNKAFNPFFISNVVLLSTVSPVLLCCGKVAVEWKSACSLYGEWIITQSYSMGSQFHFRATKGFKMVILPGKRSKPGLNEDLVCHNADTKDGTQHNTGWVLLFMCVCSEGSGVLTGDKTSHTLINEALPLCNISTWMCQ